MPITPEIRTTQGATQVALQSITPEVHVTQAPAQTAIASSNILRTTQGYALTAINFPTPEGRVTQAAGVVAFMSSNTLRTTQAVVHVAIKFGTDDRLLRGWTFTQDDHDFYVLQLGGSGTLVFDKLTGQWSQWVSPGVPFWSGQDGCDWHGFNVCCDPLDGTIHKIDPDNRLDGHTTPIISQVFAIITARFRKMVPVFMAELAISEAKPPAGIDPGSVGISLSTDDTITTVDHGTVTGEVTGNMTYARWYGLGMAQSPGIRFSITDTGYARRIDGLTIEIGG